MHQVCKDKIEELSLLADGMLSIDKAKELEKHLSLCPACDKYYSDIKAMKSSMAALSLEAPENINELISKAIRKTPVNKNYRRYIYRYATVAAACLVLVVFLFSRGLLLNMGADKSNDSAELRGLENAPAAELSNNNSYTIFADSNVEESDVLDDASKVAAGTEEMLMAEPNPDGSSRMYGSLEDYKYMTSAIENENFLIVNPNGLPLDSGYGGMQDIFYASGAYTIDEMSAILVKEFNISEIWNENENLFFYIDSKNLQKLEFRLALVSSDKLEEKKNSVSVRIVAIEKSDNK
ncbi:MAG: hypothetical protein KAH14_07715 [Clostridiales bacterium]|nr:hypothetical protein [Clostridiales bacterium]